MDIRCHGCAQRHPGRRPTLLGEAELVDVQKAASYGRAAEIAVYPFRRRGRREVEARRAAMERTGVLALVRGDVGMGEGRSERLAGQLDARGNEVSAYSSETRSVALPCRQCRTRRGGPLRIDLALERLRPALEAGYPEVLVGANGEVVPVGAPA